MRVLVITRAPWRDDNNTGNTCSNFFEGVENVEFYSMCLRDQAPNNKIAIKNFSISEGQLIQNLKKGTKVGRITETNEKTTSNAELAEQKTYDRAKKAGSFFLMFCREMLWSVGRWKNENLVSYIKEVSPDVIFMPVFNCFYPHKVLNFIAKYTDAKIILFHADDNYTLKQYSLSPLFWLHRFGLRKWVRKSVKLSSVNYVISELQKQEYEKAFHKPCKLLTKFADFSIPPETKAEYNTPLQLVFTGNVLMGRWKSLAMITNVLQKINQNGTKAELRIYTANALTDEMRNALEIAGSSYIMGCVPAAEIANIQQEADILVHAEGMNLRSKLMVRQSFSTKIVDYFKSARPILAVGPRDVASFQHLIQNDCAIVASSEDELEKQLSEVLADTSALTAIAKKGYLCGAQYHDEAKTRAMLAEDFGF